MESQAPTASCKQATNTPLWLSGKLRLHRLIVVTGVIDLYVTELTGMYPRTYAVVVEGKIYDSFHCFNGSRPLTMMEMFDVAEGYKEALDGFQSPVV